MKFSILIFFIFLLTACNSTKNDFELCSNNKYPYYHPTLDYEGDFYEIKSHFYKNYHKNSEQNNTGIVRIQFQVNCLGDTGNFKMETYSLEYKKTTIINEKVTQDLLQLTKGLKKWIPAINENGENIDSHKFFAFKLIDGELIDILPK